MNDVLTVSPEVFEELLSLSDADLREVLQDISSVFFGGAPLRTLTIEDSSDVPVPMIVNTL